MQTSTHNLISFANLPPSPWQTASSRSKPVDITLLACKWATPILGLRHAVLDVALKAMQDGLTHYGPSRGYLDLRTAVASKLIRDEGVSYDPASEIIITHGGIHAYYLAMQSDLKSRR